MYSGVLREYLQRKSQVAEQVAYVIIVVVVRDKFCYALCLFFWPAHTRLSNAE